MVTAVAVVLDLPMPSRAALMSFPRRLRARASSRRPACETRTLTLARLPAGIENRARPRVTDRAAPERVRRTLSSVRPEQRPTVPAGQLSLSAMNLPPKVSLADTRLTPAKGGVAAGVGVVEVELGGGEAVVKVWSAPFVMLPALVATSR